MFKNLIQIFTFLLIGVSSIYGQNAELKNWNFRLEKDTSITSVSIPHTWNLKDPFDDEPGYFKGKGIYTSEFEIQNISKQFYIVFKGVNQEAKVWINDQFIGEHFGGYTAFQFPISEFVKSGKNSVKVEVNNAYNNQIAPLDADFTFFGGIYRQVFIEEENIVHLEKKFGADVVKFDALPTSSNSGTLKIFGEIQNSNQQQLTVEVNLINAIGKSVFQKILTVKSSFKFEEKLTKLDLWSPDNPYLYTVKVEILDSKKQILDTFQNKIGFRKIEASVKGFKINDKPLKLIGVNRHQDLEGFANAVPVNLQVKDLVKIKEMGSNFLRLAHYPQDQEIYNVADSLGLILWSEIPVVNKVPIGEDYNAYEANAIQMQQEHIAQNYNHASLVFIGYMNEIFLRMVFDKPNEEEKAEIVTNSVKLAKKLEQLTRDEAPNHITVMALHGNQIYNETDIASIPMVIGWNLYYGWYEGEINNLGPFLDSENKKYPNRPIILSEYGVGSDIRIRSNNPKKFDFSEDYQTEYHQGYWNQVMDRDFVIGMSAWNYADFSSEFRGDTKPHINQKGLVNYDRTPKNIFYWYKAILNSETSEIKFFSEIPEHISESNNKQIKIISNRAVILKVNGKNLAVNKPVNGIIITNVNLREGENTLKVYDKFLKLADSMNLFWKKPQLQNIGDKIAVNFGTDITFLDSENQVWIPFADAPIVQIKGDYKKSTTSTNIRKTVDDPIFQSMFTNIQEIEISAPKGNYLVEIYWSNFGKQEKLAYELGKTNTLGATDASEGILLVNKNKLEIPRIEKFHFQERQISTISKKGNIIIKSPKDTLFSISGIVVTKQ